MNKAEIVVEFSGLKLGKHQFTYNVGQAFFDLFEFEQEFSQPNLVVSLDLEKKHTFLVCDFQIKGTMELSCDVSLERYQQIISVDWHLVINFGEEFDDSSDELLIIPETEYKVNVSQYVYETILLEIPLKRIHPNLVAEYEEEDDDLEEETEEELESNTTKEENKEIDPRWDKLKDLLK